jgi:Holliday junction DNA helicase RuvA
MIGLVRGTLVGTRGDRVTVEVGGVGYEMTVSIRTAGDLPPSGSEVCLYTHLHLRDDGLALYGFGTETERDLFRVLLGASGVGPRVALAMLGVFGPEDLRRVVATEDVDSLTRVPGIGRRTAQKVILDLKPRFESEEAEVVDTDGELSQVRQALENLGYGAGEIQEAISQIDREAALGDKIRQALRVLGR